MSKITFFEVGQALFCKEQVDGITFVYDCGGENKNKIEKAINVVFNEKDVMHI